MRKKIAILTFHRSINYGAVLQAFALKSVITELNADCSIIDYKNQFIEDINQVKLLNFNSTKDFINGIITYPTKKKKFNKFIHFRKKYLQPVEFNANDQKMFDVFITGSDQVWNYRLSNFDKTYFLDFVNDNRKKNSYAASFGFSEIPEEHTELYRSLLKGFNNISIRETQGAKIIADLINQDKPVVLDPTLLLDKKQWESMFNIRRGIAINKKYILLYLMISEPAIVKFTEKLASETGYEIIYITDKLVRKLNATYERTVSPVEWLELFLNATYIVTNSFHGVAFSINFNKEFFMGLLPSSADVNSRLENIIKLFGLEDRKITRNTQMDMKPGIDYNRVNSILQSEKVKSKEYLMKILDNTNE